MEADSFIFEVTAPGHVCPLGEGALRNGNNVLCCAVDLQVLLTFEEHQKELFELHLGNYKHTVSFSYEELNERLLSQMPLLHNNSSASFSWETPEFIDLYKVMPLVIAFVNSITQVKLQDVYHEFALYDFFLIAAGFMSSVNVEFQPFSVVIKSDIPIGIDAGNIEAHSVCIAAAFVHYLRFRVWKTGRLNENISKSKLKISKITPFTLDTFDTNEKDIIFKWSCLSEKLLPAHTYGIGSSVSTYGELLKFTKGVDEFRPSLGPLTYTMIVKILIVDSREKPDRNRLKHEIDGFAKTFPDVIESMSKLQETLSDITVGLLTDPAASQKKDKKFAELGIGVSWNISLLRNQTGISAKCIFFTRAL